MKRARLMAAAVLLVSCAARPKMHDIAHAWLLDMQVDYDTIACTQFDQAFCGTRRVDTCHVRLTTSDVATIRCRNYGGDDDAGGCTPFNGNDQLLLSRSRKQH